MPSPSVGIAGSMLAMHPYAPILVLILAVVSMAGAILILTHLIGPKRKGPIKDDTYEAGMAAIGDARRRFNVQFYVVAMMFLLFDVEIVFLWPWAVVFYDVAVKGVPLETAGGGLSAGYLLGAMAVFFLILVVGYVYDWGKGVFRWS